MAPSTQVPSTQGLSTRARRTPKPSEKVVANQQPLATTTAKVSKAKKRATPRARSQSAQRALADAVEITSSPPLSPPPYLPLSIDRSSSSESDEEVALLKKQARRRAERAKDAARVVLQQARIRAEAAAVSQPEGSEPEGSQPEENHEWFDYTFQWRIVHKKETLKATMRTISAEWRHMQMEAPIAWFNEQIALMPTYALSQIVLYAGHDRIGIKAHNQGEPSDFGRLVEKIVGWWEEGKRGLIIVAEAQTTMAALSMPSQGGASQGRRTATSNQLAALASQRERENDDTPASFDITEAWICKVKSCLNYSKLCYWGVRDAREYHLPIYSAIITQWSAAIRSGVCTVAVPTPAIVQQLTIESARRKSGKGSSKKDDNENRRNVGHGSGIVIHNHFGGPSASDKSATAAPQPPPYSFRSSPVPELSSQTPVTRLLEEFFEWCVGRAEWAAEEMVLRTMAVELQEHGFSVPALANIRTPEWKELELSHGGIGYQIRLKTAAKRWINERGQRSGSNSPQSDVVSG